MPPQIGSIGEAWRDYRDKVVPKGASAAQIRDTRVSFYAGAYALFSLMSTRLEPGADPTANDINFMAGLQRELLAFSDEVNGVCSASGEP